MVKTKKETILTEVVDIYENVCSSCGGLVLEDKWIDGNICPFCGRKK